MRVSGFVVMFVLFIRICRTFRFLRLIEVVYEYVYRMILWRFSSNFFVFFSVFLYLCVGILFGYLGIFLC